MEIFNANTDNTLSNPDQIKVGQTPNSRADTPSHELRSWTMLKGFKAFCCAATSSIWRSRSWIGGAFGAAAVAALVEGSR